MWTRVAVTEKYGACDGRKYLIRSNCFIHPAPRDQNLRDLADCITRVILQNEGVPTAVVSMPCWLLFEEQDKAYRKKVLGETRARVAVEAAVELGWGRYLGFEGRFVGMHGFGESGKIGDVYTKFDITTAAVVRAARETLMEVWPSM